MRPDPRRGFSQALEYRNQQMGVGCACLPVCSSPLVLPARAGSLASSVSLKCARVHAGFTPVAAGLAAPTRRILSARTAPSEFRCALLCVSAQRLPDAVPPSTAVVCHVCCSSPALRCAGFIWILLPFSVAGLTDKGRGASRSRPYHGQLEQPHSFRVRTLHPARSGLRHVDLTCVLTIDPGRACVFHLQRQGQRAGRQRQAFE